MKVKKTNTYEKIAVSLLFLICIIPALLLNTVNPSGHKLTILDNRIKIKSETCDIEDIELIDDEIIIYNDENSNDANETYKKIINKV